MTILICFTCMVKIVALKFSTPPFVSVKWSWVFWILSEKYFSQNQRKLRNMLSYTYICNLSAHSDHGHLFWASRKTSFQCLHLHRAAINTRYEKMSVTSSLAEISSTALICRKSLDNLVLFLNMCLIHIQENALLCNMEIVRFSP